MTINELLDALQDIAATGGGDREIRIATQPTYPLAFHLDEVKDGDEQLGDAFRRVQFRSRFIPGLESLGDEEVEEAVDEIVDEIADEYEVDHDTLRKATLHDELPDSPVWLTTGSHPDDSPYASKRLWS